MVESLRAALAVADAHGEISFANAAFAQLAGRKPESLAGASLGKAMVKLLAPPKKPAASRCVPTAWCTA